MSKSHACLSPSSSKRWLSCPPSARLCAEVPDEETEYAREGTDAHALCEYKVRKALGSKVENPVENLTYFNAEMDECSDNYLSFVLEEFEEAKKLCKDPIVLVEQRLDFSRWVPEGFGTGDCLIVADKVLEIIDFKYGLGVLVDAKENPQMMCYALGALETYDGIYDIEEIKMTIFQPRRANVSTWTTGKDDLLKWADEVLAPTAKLAYEGKGDFQAGDHCRFCKVRAACRARAEKNMSLAKEEFTEPSLLSDDEIAEILPQVDEFISWASDIKDYALQQALSGTEYKGFKLVEGRAVRKYTDERLVAKTVEEAGYDPYERKLMGITAMTSLLGKKQFNDLLGDMIMKPPGKPALVPESDKRPAMNTAKDDFKGEE